MNIVDFKLLEQDINYIEHLLARASTAPYSVYFFVDLVNKNEDEIKNINIQEFHTLYYDSLYMENGFYKGYLALNERTPNLSGYAQIVGNDFINYISMYMNENEIMGFLENIGMRNIVFIPSKVIEETINEIKNMTESQ